ncbi:MAG: ABC transporter permease [Chlorobi bacterium]|nr:ABC transporter permease [Chlorobiota bacterium]
MNIIESILLALGAIAQNKLRSFFTLLSIAIGIFAIIGVGTLVSSMESAIFTEMDAMGENSFIVSQRPSMITSGREWRKYSKRKPITYSQVEHLKDEMQTAEMITVQSEAGGHTVINGNNKTNSNVKVVGTDENFFEIFNFGIAEGRGLSKEDIMYNRNVIVIGNDIAVKCFPDGSSPINERVKIKNQTYTVIGLLSIKGAMFGQSQDNMVLIPVTNYLKYFSNKWNESLRVTIKSDSRDNMEDCMDETIGLLRTVRNVKPWEQNDFEIETNEFITEQFSSFTKYISFFGLVCGGFVLLAAGVGIMNIMLISVKERTREIGLRKAVGAKRHWIVIQFIIETITLCQVGGAFGVVGGFLAASLLSMQIELTLVVPMGWILFSVGVCTFLGVTFGAYPAWKAAKLDPIEALRYE